jgi:cytochrome c1
MGKDAISFLSWAAEPEMEKRKLVTLVATSLQNYLRQV